MHAGLVERLLVMRDVAIGMRQRPGKAPGLQRHDRVARGALGVVHFCDVTAGPGLNLRHGHPALLRVYFLLVSTVGSHVPATVREWPRNSAITESPTVTRTS